MEKKIYIVGIGPGSIKKMTLEAYEILKVSQVIVGYEVYIDLIKEEFPNKEYFSTPMKQEIKRCEKCFEFAREGKITSLICSGDAGVYGMASPMLELQKNNQEYKDIELVVIPGLTAANSGASELGAPLNHDYCVISLSDLLTPWEAIQKRLQAAITGDFVIALYNPSSYKRKDYLMKAVEIMMEAGAKKDRACAYVENIGRKNTKIQICTLEELKSEEVNMFTTVFIGNSQTEIYTSKDGKKSLITKRGYNI